MNPQISLFNNFFIKNGSHNIIYTFKNYFATVISAISFQFQQNKSYPNIPSVFLVLNWVRVLVNFKSKYFFITSAKKKTIHLKCKTLETSEI